MSRWVTLKAFGFCYFEVYVNSEGESVAWISRTTINARYSVFFCDGHHKVASTRGSMKNARALAVSAVTTYNAS